MKKPTVMKIILVASSVLILVGVSLMAWMMLSPGNRSDITVYLKDGKTETVEFEHLCLIPGEQCEYTITLESIIAKSFEVKLNFVETKEGSNLKDYARVKIISDGEVVLDELLADVLKGNDVKLTVDFSAKSSDEFTVIYYLPPEVGNEVQGAEASFDLNITANNE